MIPLAKMRKMHETAARKRAVVRASSFDHADIDDCTKDNPAECRIHGTKALAKTDEIGNSAKHPLLAKLDALAIDGIDEKTIEAATRDIRASKTFKDVEGLQKAFDEATAQLEATKGNVLRRQLLLKQKYAELELYESLSQLADMNMTALKKVLGHSDVRGLVDSSFSYSDEVESDDVATVKKVADFAFGFADKSVLPKKKIACGLELVERNHVTKDFSRMQLHFGVIPSQVIHEIGHFIEGSNSHILLECSRFLDERCNGEQIVCVGKDANEKGRKDRFLDAYTGKDYIANGKRYATEVLSMGLQYLVTNPYEFYKSDRQHFMMTVGLMKGMV